MRNNTPKISRNDVLRVLHLLNNDSEYPASMVAAALQVPESTVHQLVALAKMVVPETAGMVDKKEFSSSEAARMVGVSKSTLYRILDELEDAGAIEVERRQKGRISERVITEDAIRRAQAHIR